MFLSSSMLVIINSVIKSYSPFKHQAQIEGYWNMATSLRTLRPFVLASSISLAKTCQRSSGVRRIVTIKAVSRQPRIPSSLKIQRRWLSSEPATEDWKAFNYAAVRPYHLSVFNRILMGIRSKKSSTHQIQK